MKNEIDRSVVGRNPLGNYLNLRAFNPHSDVPFGEQDPIHNVIPYVRYQRVSVAWMLGTLLPNKERQIKLANGSFLCSGCVDYHDPQALPFGEWIRIEDAQGQEVCYLEAADCESPRVYMFKVLEALLKLNSAKTGVEAHDDEEAVPAAQTS